MQADESPSYEGQNIVPIHSELGPEGFRGIKSDKPGITVSGGGGMDGLEPRVAKLEAHVEHIVRDLGDVKPDVRDMRDRLIAIEETVKHLPRKGYINKAVTAAVVLLGLFITFQAQIQSLVGTAPS